MPTALKLSSIGSISLRWTKSPSEDSCMSAMVGTSRATMRAVRWLSYGPPSTICGLTTMLSLLVALNLLTSVVMMPHSPRPAFTLINLLKSASQEPKKRASVISVLAWASALPAAQASRPMTARCDVIFMRVSLWVIDGSSLHGRAGHRRNDVFLEKQVEDEHRQPCEHRLRHQVADAFGLAEVGLGGRQPQGERVHLRFGRRNQRPQIIVPRMQEGEDAQGRLRGDR